MVARGKEGGEGTVRELEMDVHTLLYSKWIATKTYWCSVGTASVLCGSLMEGSLGEKGGMDIYG